MYFETLHSFDVHILLWLNTECTVWSTIKIQYMQIQQYGPGWTKLQFLGPIISKSKRFTSFLMPDLDSTAKSNPKNNSLNLVGGFITKFLALSTLVFFRVAMHFKVGADPVPPGDRYIERKDER